MRRKDTEMEINRNVVGSYAFYRQGRLGVRLLVGFVLLAVLLCVASTVSADTAGDKALRGLSNVLAGVMAFPGEIYKAWNKDGPGYGLTVGVALGIGMIPARELIGILELVTSPAAWPNPRFGPLLTPAYPWGYFQK